MDDFLKRNSRASNIGLLTIMAALALMTFAAKMFGGDAIQITVTEMLIRLVVVIGLYVFIGNSGIVSFGHIGFMCIGAYASAWMTVQVPFKQMMLQGLPGFLQNYQYPFLAAMVVAAVLPAIVAFLFGIALVRLNGIAASIATFAFLMIVYSAYSNWDSVTAGVSSIVGVPTVVTPYVALVFACLALAVAFVFQRSRYGLMLKASRDEEIAASAVGVKVPAMRLLSLVISAALCGLGGGLYAHFLGILTTDVFYLNLSFITLSMLVVGGLGSLTGAVSGVVLVTVIVTIFRQLEQGIAIGAMTVSLPQGTQEIVLGAVIALVLIFRPTGVFKGKELLIRLPGRLGSPGAGMHAPAANRTGQQVNGNQ
ncbi:branched-chain amino acid ABC transporter permease [Paraburkholderia bannensis]|uniref:branched-chain amino acid ABC transporter permease n=1 Tax=Paraburkholderia bannensis TaxID=765414 RepID=UPI002AB7AA7D|nr:branched-chain amino acid ABC transporter permease [Paraburkholderia bannensis]